MVALHFASVPHRTRPDRGMGAECGYRFQSPSFWMRRQFRENILVKNNVRQFVRKAEPIAARMSLVDILVDPKLSKIARCKRIDFMRVREPWHRNNVNFEIEFDDRLDWNWKRAG